MGGVKWLCSNISCKINITTINFRLSRSLYFSKFMKIMLIRHGKVNHPPFAIISAASFSNWVTAYDKNKLDKLSIPTEEVLDIVSKAKAIVCSKLIRSQDSAKVLGVKNITYSSSIFNEAGLPTTNWRFPLLSVRIWVILFRLFWLVGYSKNSESLSETRVRATKAIDELIDLAVIHDSVAFIGHGIFNRMLANRLLEAGWVGPRTPSSEYWGFGVYEK